MNTTRIAIDVHFDPEAAGVQMAREIREGLTAVPKSIPPKYFYDERGSLLFERITELPEYYLTRAERGLLERVAGEIARATRPRQVVELGSGSAKKTRLLLDAAVAEGRLETFVPFDVSREIAESSAESLLQRYAGLRVHAVVGDFERHLGELPAGSDRLVALLGSTIGNFPRAEAARLLSRVEAVMSGGDRLLLGTDLVKDRTVIEAAYNDAAGVTAEFNRNVLRVLNDRLDGDFDPESFEHVAFYDDARERIEMHLRSMRPQRATLRAIGLEVSFEDRESVRTEVSCKYTRASVRDVLADAGFVLERWWSDEANAFALSLARPSRLDH